MNTEIIHKEAITDKISHLITRVEPDAGFVTQLKHQLSDQMRKRGNLLPLNIFHSFVIGAFIGVSIYVFSKMMREKKS